MNTGRTDFVAESSFVAGAEGPAIFDVSLVRPGEDAFNIGVTETFPLAEPVRAGADPMNEIVLDGKKIAPFHATFAIGAQGPRLVLADGAEATVADRVVTGVVGLLPGEDIVIGRNRLTLRFRDECRNVESDWELMSRDGQASLHLVDEISIGQGQTCDLQLIEDQVCERHARLVPMQGMLWVQDLSDGNTYVNGDPVAGAVLLHHGDVVRFATAGFKVVERGPRARAADSVATVDSRRSSSREERQEHSESLFWQTLRRDSIDDVESIDVDETNGVAPPSWADELNRTGERLGARARAAQHPRPTRRSAGAVAYGDVNVANPARIAPAPAHGITPGHGPGAPEDLVGEAPARGMLQDFELEPASKPRRAEPDTVIQPSADPLRVSVPWVRARRRRSTAGVWFLASAVAIAVFAWAPVVVKNNSIESIGSAVDRVKEIARRVSLPIVQWYQNEIAQTARAPETPLQGTSAANVEVAIPSVALGAGSVAESDDVTALQHAAAAGDTAAANRLREIRQGYVEQATEALQRGDVTRAPELLQLAAMIEPTGAVTTPEVAAVAGAPNTDPTPIDQAISRARALATGGISTFSASDQEVVETLVAALRVDQANATAGEALNAVVGELARRIDTHLTRHQFADATNLLSAIRDAGVPVDALANASDRPTFVDAQLWKALSVASLLVEADRMIQRGTIVASQGDSALSLLQRALQLDPENEIAADMGVKSAGLLFQAARRAEENGQSDESRRLSELAALVRESTNGRDS